MNEQKTASLDIKKLQKGILPAYFDQQEALAAKEATKDVNEQGNNEESNEDNEVEDQGMKKNNDEIEDKEHENDQEQEESQPLIVRKDRKSQSGKFGLGENSNRTIFENYSGRMYIDKNLKKKLKNEEKDETKKSFWKGLNKKMIIRLVALSPFYMLILALSIYLISNHTSTIHPKLFGNFGSLKGQKLDLHINNCMVYVLANDMNDGQTGIVKLQRSDPWILWLSSSFESSYDVIDGKINILVNNTNPIQFCNLTLFIEENNVPASLSVTCTNECSFIQASNELVIDGETIIKGEDIYVNIANLNTNKLVVKGQEGYVQINMITTDPDVENEIKLTNKGDIIVQSVNSINIVNFDSPTQTFCFGGPTINIQTEDCEVSGQDNEGTGNAKCTGKGQIDSENPTNLQNFKVSTNSGNLYLNVLPDVQTPLPSTSTIFKSSSYAKGFDFDPYTAQQVNNFLHIVNSSTFNDPMLVLNLGGNQLAWSTSYTKWVIPSNPAYDNLKPWAITAISAGLLTGYVIEVDGQLLPGICPWRPSLNTRDLFNVASFLNTKKGNVAGDATFVYNEDPTPQELEDYQPLSGVQTPDDNWVPWYDEWYTVDQSAQGDILFNDQSLSSDTPIFIALILSVIVALLIGIVAISIAIYSLNYLTYTVKTKGLSQLVYTRLLTLTKSPNHQIIDINEGDNSGDGDNQKRTNGNNTIPPTKTINPITNLIYLWGNFVHVTSYFDYLVLTLAKNNANSLKLFFDILFRNKSENDVDSYDINNEMINFDEIANEYQKFCFLNHMNEEPFEENNVNSLINEKGFEVKHEDLNIMVFTNLVTKKTQGSIRLSVGDDDMDSLSLFFKYNIMITSFEEDEIEVSTFKTLYADFCQKQNLSPTVITPQLMKAKYNISTKNVPLVSIRRANDKNNIMVNAMVIDKQKLDNLLNYLSDNSKHLAIEEFKDIKNILYSQEGYLYEFLNIILQYLFIMLLVFPVIIMIIIINTSYEPYSLKNPAYLLSWDSFIYQPKVAFTHIPFALQAFFILIIVLNFGDFLTYTPLMKRPIEIYFRQPNKDNWIRIVAFINWMLIILLFFIYFTLLGLIFTWILLGAIINPTLLLPYAAAAMTFITFITAKYAEFSEILEKFYKIVMNYFENNFKKLTETLIKKFGVSLLKQQHAPFQKAQNILQNTSLRNIANNLGEKGIIPKDALKTISKKLDDLCTSKDQGLPPIVDKLENDPTFIEHEFTILANNIENGFIASIKSELHNKKIPNALIGLVLSFIIKDNQNIQAQFIEFLDYLEQEHIASSDALSFLKTVLFPSKSTLTEANLKLLAKDLINVFISTLGSRNERRIFSERILNCYSVPKQILNEDWDNLGASLRRLIRNNPALEILKKHNNDAQELILVTLDFTILKIQNNFKEDEARKCLLKVIKTLKDKSFKRNDVGYRCAIRYHGNDFNDINNYVNAVFQNFYVTSEKFINLLKKSSLIYEVPLEPITGRFSQICNVIYHHLDYDSWVNNKKCVYINEDKKKDIAAPLDVGLFLLRKEATNISPEALNHLTKNIFKAQFKEETSNIEMYLSEEFTQFMMTMCSSIFNANSLYYQKVINFQIDIPEDLKSFIVFTSILRFKAWRSVSFSNTYLVNISDKYKVKPEAIYGLLSMWWGACSYSYTSDFIDNIIINSINIPISKITIEAIHHILVIYISTRQSDISTAIYKLKLPLDRFLYMTKGLLKYNMLVKDDYEIIINELKLENQDEITTLRQKFATLKETRSYTMWKVNFLSILGDIFVMHQDDGEIVKKLMILNAYIELENETNEGFLKVFSALMPENQETMALLKSDQFLKLMGAIIEMRTLSLEFNNGSYFKHLDKRMSAKLIKFGSYANMNTDFLENLFKLAYIVDFEAYKEALSFFIDSIPSQAEELIRFAFSQFRAYRFECDIFTDCAKYITWTEKSANPNDSKQITITSPSDLLWFAFGGSCNSDIFIRFQTYIEFINNIMKTSRKYYKFAYQFEESELRNELFELSKLNSGILDQTRKGQTVIYNLIELMCLSDRTTSLSTLISKFPNKDNNLLCTSLVLFGVFKGWGDKSIKLSPNEPEITYKQLAAKQLSLNKAQQIHSEFFDLFSAIIKKDIPSFVDSCKRIIRMIKKKSYFDRELIVSALSFLNGQFYNFDPIAKKIDISAELLEFCAGLYQLKNPATRVSCFEYLETSVVCDSIFNKLSIKSSEFLGMARLIYSAFDANHTFENCIKKIDSKSLVDLKFLKGIIDLYELKIKPDTTSNSSLKTFESNKKKMDHLLDLLDLETHISTIALSLKIGNFLILESLKCDFDWVFGKLENNEITNESRLLIHITEGLCGIINTNVKKANDPISDPTTSLDHAISKLSSSILLDNNWLEIGLNIIDAEKAPLSILLDNTEENLVKFFFMSSFTRLSPSQIDYLGLIDWHTAFLYYFKYDIKSKTENGKYIKLFSKCGNFLLKFAQEILMMPYKHVQGLFSNIFSSKLNIKDQKSYNKVYNKIFSNAMIDILNNPNFVVHFDDNTRFHDMINKAEQVLLEFSTEGSTRCYSNLSELYHTLSGMLNETIYEMLVLCLIPYFYEKYSTRKKFPNKPYNNTSLSLSFMPFIDLGIMSNLIKLRQLGNTDDHYAENVFIMNIMLTNIERKLIFINGETLKIFRKFSLMKLLGFSKGLLIPNAFEMILSPPVYDIHDLTNKKFYGYKSASILDLQDYILEAEEFLKVYNLDDENFCSFGEENSKYDYSSAYHLMATYGIDSQMSVKQILNILEHCLTWQQLNSNTKNFVELLNLFNNELIQTITELTIKTRYDVIHYIKQNQSISLLNKSESNPNTSDRDIDDEKNDWEAILKSIMRTLRLESDSLLYMNFDFWTQKSMDLINEIDNKKEDKNLIDLKTKVNYQIIEEKIKDIEIETMKPNLKMLFNIYDMNYQFDKVTIETLGRDYLMDHGPDVKALKEVTINLISYLQNENNQENISDLLSKINIISDQKSLGDLIIFLCSKSVKSLDCLRSTFDLSQDSLDYLNAMMKTYYYRQDNLEYLFNHQNIVFTKCYYVCLNREKVSEGLKDFIPITVHKLINKLTTTENEIIQLLHALFNFHKPAWKYFGNLCLVQDNNITGTTNNDLNKPNLSNDENNLIFCLINLVKFKEINTYLESSSYSSTCEDFTSIYNVFNFPCEGGPKNILLCTIIQTLARYMPEQLEISLNETNDNKIKNAYLTQNQKDIYFVCRAINRLIETKAGWYDMELLDLFFTDYENNTQENFLWKETNYEMSDEDLKNAFITNLKKFDRFITKTKDSTFDESPTLTQEETYHATKLAWLILFKNDCLSTIQANMKYVNAIFKINQYKDNRLSLYSSFGVNYKSSYDYVIQNLKKEYLIAFVAWMKGDFALLINSFDTNTPGFAIVASVFIYSCFPIVVQYYYYKPIKVVEENEENRHKMILKMLEKKLRPATFTLMPVFKLIEANFHGSQLNISNPSVKEWIDYACQNADSVKFIASNVLSTRIDNYYTDVAYTWVAQIYKDDLHSLYFNRINKPDSEWNPNKLFISFVDRPYKLDEDDGDDNGDGHSINNSKDPNEAYDHDTPENHQPKCSAYYNALRALFCLEDFFFVTWEYWSDKKENNSYDWIYLNQYLTIIEHHLGKNYYNHQMKNHPLIHKDIAIQEDDSIQNEYKIQRDICTHMGMVQNLIRNGLCDLKSNSKIKTEMFVDVISLLLERLCGNINIANQTKNSQEFMFLKQLITLYSVITGYDFASVLDKSCNEDDCMTCKYDNLVHLSYHLVNSLDELIEQNKLDALIMRNNVRKEKLQKLYPILLGILHNKVDDTWNPNLEKQNALENLEYETLEDEIQSEKDDFESELSDEESKQSEGNEKIEESLQIETAKSDQIHQTKPEENMKKLEKQTENQSEISKITTSYGKYNYANFQGFQTKVFKLLNIIFNNVPKDISIKKKFSDLLENVFLSVEDICTITYKPNNSIISHEEQKNHHKELEKISNLSKLAKSLYKFKNGEVDQISQLIEFVTKNDTDKSKTILEFVKNSIKLLDLQNLKDFITIPTATEANPKIKTTKSILKKADSGITDENDLFKLCCIAAGQINKIDISDFATLAKRLGAPLSEHKIKEIFAHIKGDNLTPESLDLTLEEFIEGLLYIKEQQVMKTLESLGITPKALFGELAYLGSLLIIIFIFIFIGIEAFTVGGTFSAVINSILPALGALSLKGKDKKNELNKVDEIEKECKKTIERLMAIKKKL